MPEKITPESHGSFVDAAKSEPEVISAKELLNMSRKMSIDLLQTTCGLSDEERDSLMADDLLLTSWAVNFFSFNEYPFTYVTPEAYRATQQPARDLLLAPHPNVAGKYGTADAPLTERLAEIVNQGPGLTGETYRSLCNFFATYVASYGAYCSFDNEWWNLFPPPQTRLQPDDNGRLGITFGAAPGYRYEFDKQPRIVATMGSGLSGARFVEDIEGYVSQVHLTACDEVHTFDLGLAHLTQDFRRMMSPPSPDTQDPEYARLWLYGGSLPRYFETARRNGINPDVVVMSAFHHAGQRRTVEIIKSVYETMPPGGTFVVKAPVETLHKDEAGLDFVREQAGPYFRQPVAEGPCGTLGHDSHDESSNFGPAGFMIFEKPPED